MSSGRRGRTGPMAAGLLLAVVTLFMAPMSIREVCTSFNGSDFVKDELELEEFRPSRGGHSEDWLTGHIVSTGEPFATDRTNLVGLDRLRDLSREGKLVGYRVPIWYLPKHGVWPAIDWINPFRVRSPEDFAQGFPAGLVAANVLFAVISVFLIRRGAGFPKAS